MSAGDEQIYGSRLRPIDRGHDPADDQNIGGFGDGIQDLRAMVASGRQLVEDGQKMLAEGVAMVAQAKQIMTDVQAILTALRNTGLTIKLP